MVEVSAGEYEAVITASRDNGGFNPETISGTLTVTITIEAAAYTIAGNDQPSYDLVENATTDTVLVGLDLVVQDISVPLIPTILTEATLSIVSGNDEGLFRLDGGTIVLNSASLDYESNQLSLIHISEPTRPY